MSNYSGLDKFLHRFYLGNYSISRAGFEMELIVSEKKASKIPVEEVIFVTGLARSGTTGLMRKLFETGQYASLQYSNMPYLLNPNLWNKKSGISSHERPHNDGIVIDGNSPEEFDEFFWKLQLNDSYIYEDHLTPHSIEIPILNLYRKFIQLICLAKGKNRYISKNNNNILRLDSLRHLEKNKVILLFREPVAHASSLLKLHKKFSNEQQNDPFTLEYFNFLGHHEFGLNHKPFKLTEYFFEAQQKYTPQDINYWVLLWVNYYEFALTKLIESDIIVCFEDLSKEPERVYSVLQSKLFSLTNFGDFDRFEPTTVLNDDINPEIEERANFIYSQLLELKL